MFPCLHSQCQRNVGKISGGHSLYVSDTLNMISNDFSDFKDVSGLKVAEVQNRTYFISTVPER